MIWVPSMAPHMFGKPMNSWYWWMTLNGCIFKNMFIYLPKSLPLSQTISQTISTYFWMVGAPTSNLFNICLKLKPWINLYNTIATTFLISSCAFIGSDILILRMKVVLQLDYWKYQKTLYNASNISYRSSLMLHVIQ